MNGATTGATNGATNGVKAQLTPNEARRANYLKGYVNREKNNVRLRSARQRLANA